MKEPLLNTQQVADQLGCSRNQVLSLIKSGRIRAVNISAGSKACYRVAPEVLDEFRNGEVQKQGRLIRKKKVKDEPLRYV